MLLKNICYNCTDGLASHCSVGEALAADAVTMTHKCQFRVPSKYFVGFVDRNNDFLKLQCYHPTLFDTQQKSTDPPWLAVPLYRGLVMPIDSCHEAVIRVQVKSLKESM